MSKPFFSIIIPVYNAETYLVECIESVLHQSFPDFEIVLINDGSKDHSLEICERYERLHPHKIKCINQENKGVLTARWTGITAAEGNYIMFLDADDLYRYDTLEQVYALIHKEDADIVVFNAALEQGFMKPLQKYSRLFYDMNQAEDKQAFYTLVCGGHDLNTLWSKAIKESLIDRSYDYSSIAHIKLGEDLLQALPWLHGAKRIALTNEMLYYYRQNPNSVTHSITFRNYQNDIDFYNELIKFAEIWQSDVNTDLLTLICNRVLNNVSREIKKAIMSDLSYDEKVEKYKEKSSSSFFREKYKTAINMVNGLINRYILWAVYHRLYWLLIPLELGAKIRKVKKA